MIWVTSATGRDTERATRMLKASNPPIATRMTAIMAIIRVCFRLAVSSAVAALTASSLSLSCAMRCVRSLDKVRKSSRPVLALRLSAKASSTSLVASPVRPFMAAWASTISWPTSVGRAAGACSVRLPSSASTSTFTPSITVGPSLRFMRPVRMARSTWFTTLARPRSAAICCFRREPTPTWVSMASSILSMPKRPTAPTSIVASTAPPAETIILPQIFIENAPLDLSLLGAKATVER